MTTPRGKAKSHRFVRCPRNWKCRCYMDWCHRKVGFGLCCLLFRENPIHARKAKPREVTVKLTEEQVRDMLDIVEGFLSYMYISKRDRRRYSQLHTRLRAALEER